MYILEQLEQKSLKELKEIGWQLNVLPASDRRFRQNWIDVIVGVNPPLLQLLEASPAPSVVEQVQPIIETVETPSAVEVELVQEPLEITPLLEKNGLRECLNCEDGFVTDRWGDIVECPRCGGSQWVNIEDVEPQVQEPIAQVIETFPGVVVDSAQEPIEQVAETSPGVEVDRVSEPKSIAHELLQLFKSSVRIEEPITETVKSSPGVEVDPAQEPIDVQRHEVIELQAQDLIEQAVENSLDVEFSGFERVTQSNRNNFSGFERVTQFNRNNFSGFERFQEPEQSDRHLILTGLTFSDRFLARYAPPQAQIIHFQSDADGQLSLLDFEVQSVDEPPDPDDFESLELFREALALWDWEHNEVSPEHNEPLQVSLDSFSLWGFCPVDWYESVALLEPPDTGVFAKLPKPNPPSFSPATVGQARVKRGLNAYQTHTKRIPKVSRTHTHCIVVGSSTQPARSPPSGDACLV